MAGDVFLEETIPAAQGYEAHDRGLLRQFQEQLSESRSIQKHPLGRTERRGDDGFLAAIRRSRGGFGFRAEMTYRPHLPFLTFHNPFQEMRGSVALTDPGTAAP